MDDKILKEIGVVAECSEVAVFVFRHHTHKIANQDGSVYSTTFNVVEMLGALGNSLCTFTSVPFALSKPVFYSDSEGPVLQGRT